MNKNGLMPAILFFLIIFEILFSGFLALSPGQASAFCTFGSSCEDVQASPYGYILGIKVSYLGFFSFIILLLLFYLASKNEKWRFWYLLSCLIGALLALYLIFIQVFVLGQFCLNCLIIDLIMVIIAVLSFIFFKYTSC